MCVFIIQKSPHIFNEQYSQLGFFPNFFMFCQLQESQERCIIKWQHVSISPKKFLKIGLRHCQTKIQVKINVFCGKISHRRDKKGEHSYEKKLPFFRNFQKDCKFLDLSPNKITKNLTRSLKKWKWCCHLIFYLFWNAHYNKKVFFFNYVFS